MNELEKLKALLHHWKEHNDEHAESYKSWAEKAAQLGRNDVAQTLEKLYADSKKLNELFEEASKLLPGTSHSHHH